MTMSPAIKSGVNTVSSLPCGTPLTNTCIALARDTRRSSSGRVLGCPRIILDADRPTGGITGALRHKRKRRVRRLTEDDSTGLCPLHTSVGPGQLVVQPELSGNGSHLHLPALPA